MRRLKVSRTRGCTLALTHAMRTTPAGTPPPSLSILATVNASSPQRKLSQLCVSLTYGASLLTCALFFFCYSRDPMLNKTRQTNEKMLMNKSKATGMGYTKPETLSKNIQK